MARRQKTSTEDMLEMFRANMVDVDTVEEIAVSMRNVFTMTTFALVASAAFIVGIAFVFAPNS